MYSRNKLYLLICIKFSKNENGINEKVIFAIVHKHCLFEKGFQVEEPLGKAPHVHEVIKRQNTYTGKINTIK